MTNLAAVAYRVRLNPATDETITTAAAFDPPPRHLKKEAGRWDDMDSDVLYASDDIELCLHECRVTIADEIVVATLELSQTLRIVDFTAALQTNAPTPFDDPNIFVAIMSRSRGHWLEICRLLARTAQELGFDGIRYASYYSQAKHNLKSINLALFGRPLRDGRLSITSVNRLRISDMTYQYQFGPVLYRAAKVGGSIDDRPK